ncbi:MAG: hypothetical protein ACYCZM_13500 [Acidimicrobiales bacterium]
MPGPGVSFLIDTQAWRYRDPRTFTVEKFTATPYAPPRPLATSDRSGLSDFVEADLKTQASLGASAYILPGVIPNGPHDDIRADTLALLEIATVATARKLLVICWHLIHDDTDDTDYAFARPSLIAKKTRALELRAGHPARPGSRPGTAAAYSLKSVRDRERAVLEQAETAYQHMVTGWQPRRPAGKARPTRPSGPRPTSVSTASARPLKFFHPWCVSMD